MSVSDFADALKNSRNS